VHISEAAEKFMATGIGNTFRHSVKQIALSFYVKTSFLSKGTVFKKQPFYNSTILYGFTRIKLIIIVDNTKSVDKQNPSWVQLYLLMKI